jgi:hypothetical protein
MNSKIRGRIATSILIGGVLGIVAGIALALVITTVNVKFPQSMVDQPS